jgi:membrane protein required for beta-lactamase induction
VNLIAIVIALAAERLLSRIRRWREYDWFGRYLQRLRGPVLFESLWDSSWGLLLLVPPLLAVAVLQQLLQGGVLSLFGLGFAVAVLIFTLGPRDLWDDVRELIAVRQAGDDDRAEALAASLCGRKGAAHDTDLVRGVFLAAHERVFGVLVWFFVLGPLGAALYRLASELPAQARKLGADEDLIEAAMRLHAVLAWVPLRVTALCYGLAGSSDDAIAGWRRAHDADTSDWADHGWLLLAETGRGALQREEGEDHHRVVMAPDDRLREAIGLVSRSLLLMLGVLAAFTIGGWAA